MSDMFHTEFQSLSACEAIQMRKKVGSLILEAYQVGLDVILENYSEPVESLIVANSEALRSLGFSGSDASLTGSLVIQLREQIKKEHPNE